MRKLVLYIACSLNGKIARMDGSVDWLENLPNPDANDYGYAEFMDSVETTVMGNKTYQQISGWDMEFPYKDKINYVLTRNVEKEEDAYVKFISDDPVAFIRMLKSGKGKNIWLIGGGQVNTLLWNHGLIDEIRVFIMPYILKSGIELFEGLPDESQLSLIRQHTFESGVTELVYTPSDNG
ncbi:dihydrofolate reductase family protein [Saccharicrinis sp. FJH54]|uniref:dihydrofolate reductase family protein n=1 Tax=Saccharicrinis sp. FJH54 TaxID=3344665 RepID=UPI0035D41741